MKPQRYANRDPYPQFRFFEDAPRGPNLRALFSDIICGVAAGLALAFVFVEFLA